MRVNLPTDFIYPTFFFISGRATGNAAKPVEPVGVFITKQTILTDGTIPPKEQQVEVFTSDTLYEPVPPDAPEADNRLDMQFESNLATYKPDLDLVVVRDTSLRGTFGRVRIDRQDTNGFQPNPGWLLTYGWLSRVAEEDPTGTTNPRKGLEGTNLADFKPDINDKFKLPTNFQNDFFNGSRLRNINYLQAGDMAEYAASVLTFQVTIPPAPSLKIRSSDRSPPPAIDLNVDTVIYDESVQRFLITWRAIFPWEDRLENAILEVN